MLPQLIIYIAYAGNCRDAGHVLSPHRRCHACGMRKLLHVISMLLSLPVCIINAYQCSADSGAYACAHIVASVLLHIISTVKPINRAACIMTQ